MSVMPDGRIVSGSSDRTVRVWDSSTGECLKVLEGHSDVSVYDLCEGFPRDCSYVPQSMSRSVCVSPSAVSSVCVVDGYASLSVCGRMIDVPVQSSYTSA